MNRSEILQQAEKMVCGHREQDYGTPENNFDIIAQLWSAYSGHAFNAVDVAMMMALLKIARIKSGTMTEDSFVDGCGYLACGGEIATKEAEPIIDREIEGGCLELKIKPGGSENED